MKKITFIVLACFAFSGLKAQSHKTQNLIVVTLDGFRWEELYRGSKSALNQFMRSYAARHSQSPRSMILMAPGWVRTELGGPVARLSIEESVPNLVNVLLKKQGSPGLEYLDYLGRTIPW